MMRWWHWLLVTLVALAVPLVPACRHYRQRVDADAARVERQRARTVQVIERHLDRYLADRARLAALPLFRPQPRLRDAGLLLNRSLPWRTTASGFPSGEVARAIATFFAETGGPTPELAVGLTDDLRARLDAWREDLPDHARDFDEVPLARQIAALLSQLSSMDHWNIDDNSPRARFQAAGPSHWIADAPVPDYEELLRWAKLRLLDGLRHGSTLPAVLEVRHLCELLLSTEEAEAADTAVVLLQYERAVWRRWVEGSPGVERLFQPLDVETLWAAHRAVAGGASLLGPLLPEGALRRVLDESAPGMCLALAVAGSLGQALRWPLEGEAREFYARLDAAVAERPARCRLATLRRDYRPLGQRAAFMAHYDLLARGDSWIERLVGALGLRARAPVHTLATGWALLETRRFLQRYATADELAELAQLAPVASGLTAAASPSAIHDAVP